MRYILFIFLISGFLKSQTLHECKLRFDTYLNYKGSIGNMVRFEKDAVVLYTRSGQVDVKIYQKELPMVAEVLEHYSLADQEKFFATKANKKYSKRQRDSVRIYIDHPKKTSTKKGSMKGLKVAIDAGHLAGSFSEAMQEQKFLYFVKDSILHPTDTIKLYEAELTYKTSLILKQMIEEEGGEVFLTRPTPGITTFGCGYSYWFANHKQRVLDSLVSIKRMEPQDYKKLTKLDEYKFFWEFFRDFELRNRARIINVYKPDVTLIIHYNVDEKNVPWKKVTNSNYTMAFIGGCYTPELFEKPKAKYNFLRLLITDQLNRSEKLAGYTVSHFNEYLKIPTACTDDADYLNSNCISTRIHGVYSRQLTLCNIINSPLVYGESLYQDNIDECEKLMDTTKTYFGIQTNERVYLVAKSYFDALKLYHFK